MRYGTNSIKYLYNMESASDCQSPILICKIIQQFIMGFGTRREILQYAFPNEFNFDDLIAIYNSHDS